MQADRVSVECVDQLAQRGTDFHADLVVSAECVASLPSAAPTFTQTVSGSSATTSVPSASPLAQTSLSCVAPTSTQTVSPSSPSSSLPSAASTSTQTVSSLT